MSETQPSTQWIANVAAGTDEPGYSGDGSIATDARLNNPFDLAF